MQFTKKDIIRDVATRSGLFQSQAEAAINALTEMLNEMGQGDEAFIRGFGVFTKKLYPARSVRDPRNGKPIITAAKTRVTFKGPATRVSQARPAE